ncbi:MAG: hypothetical protein A3H31_03885 [Gallionellales bacterium RIFCSPLOWO2_02_FULL_57_47]|nr:MAG: hypothetical protein A3H31_03885 [Gallionellales bacterium RIFCSPLOWO2_02_FULL_57_47]
MAFNVSGRTMNNLFRPAISLMNKLRYTHKFMVLALIYLIAVTVVFYSLYTNLSREIYRSQRELEGLALIRPVARTMQIMQQHRGLELGLIGGKESMRTAHDAKENGIDAALAELERQLPADLSSGVDWKNIKAGWESLRGGALAGTTEESFAAHTDLIDQLQMFMVNIADLRGLTLDSDIDLYYSIDTAVNALPRALEKMGQMRAYGTSVLASKQISEYQQHRMLELITELRSAFKTLGISLDKTAFHNPSMQDRLLLVSGDIGKLEQQITSLLLTDVLSQFFATSSESFYMLATEAIDEGYAQLYQTLLPATESLINARIQREQNELLISAAIASLLLLAASYFFIGVYHSMIDSIRSLARSAQNFANGNLYERIHLDTRDELSRVGDSFNEMADGFNLLLVTRLEGKERLLSIVDTALDAVIQMDANGLITGWNKQAEQCFGWAYGEAVGRKLGETIIPPRYREAHTRGLKHFLESGDGPALGRRIEMTGLHRDGHEFPIELSVSAIRTAGAVEFNAFIRDISERKRAENSLRKLSQAVEQSHSAIFITDLNANIEYANDAFLKTSCYNLGEVIGKNPRLLSCGKTPREIYADMWAKITRGETWEGELINRRKDGSEYTDLTKISPLRQPDGRITHYLAIKEDITDRKLAEEEIQQLAFYDPLTKLPNRRLLMDRLQQALAATTRGGEHGALLFIDLDNFKTLNDSLGHDIGDLLLRQVAQRLTGCVREGDTVARLGGDEFVVMLGDLSENSREAAFQSETIGEKILASLNQPYQLAGHDCHSTPSIGITLFAGPHSSLEEVLKRADISMYQAKKAGRNTIRFFDPEVQAAVTARASLETDLRHALDNSQLQLYYQVQVNEKNQAIGAEALLRWMHPDIGMVPPMQFIALAEETGLILPIGQWVLETACKQIKKWETNPHTRDLKLAINISARQFRQPDFDVQVCKIIRQAAINPARLEIELTESLVHGDISDTVAKMHTLKKMGVSFSLDDFGTGYSSLAYLTQLPLDKLKIDQSFVRNIGTKNTDALIIQTIVGMANNLGIVVIAEGVETPSQRNFLEDVGCMLYQGHLFNKPVTMEEFEKKLVASFAV